MRYIVVALAILLIMLMFRPVAHILIQVLTDTAAVPTCGLGKHPELQVRRLDVAQLPSFNGILRHIGTTNPSLYAPPAALGKHRTSWDVAVRHIPASCGPMMLLEYARQWLYPRSALPQPEVAVHSLAYPFATTATAGVVATAVLDVVPHPHSWRPPLLNKSGSWEDPRMILHEGQQWIVMYGAVPANTLWLQARGNPNGSDSYAGLPVVPLLYDTGPAGTQKNWLYVPVAVAEDPWAGDHGSTSLMLFMTSAQPLTFALVDPTTGRSREIYKHAGATPGLPLDVHSSGLLALPGPQEGDAHRFLVFVHHHAFPYSPHVHASQYMPFYRDWVIEIELRGVRSLADQGSKGATTCTRSLDCGNATAATAQRHGKSDGCFSARVTRCSTALVLPTVSSAGTLGQGARVQFLSTLLWDPNSPVEDPHVIGSYGSGDCEAHVIRWPLRALMSALSDRCATPEIKCSGLDKAPAASMHTDSNSGTMPVHVRGGLRNSSVLNPAAVDYEAQYLDGDTCGESPTARMLRRIDVWLGYT